ncbi:MAG: hypothetical protein KGL39_47240 [Patescibacteria group bacterium]|nr:hypothetical protein [Patescibacteria group bacterium]
MNSEIDGIHSCSFHCVRPACVEQVRRRDYENRAVMQQALEALERALHEFETLPHSYGYSFTHAEPTAQAIAALKEALK